MQIYITRDGTQEGPFSFEQVRARVTDGSLTPTDLAWYEGCAEWIPLSRIPGVFATTPRSLGKPVTVTPGQSVASVSQVRPWVRYSARLIDISLFGFCLSLILGLVAPSLFKSINFVLFSMVPTTFLWCFIEAFFLSKWGATPGKALLRVSVRNLDGSLLNYGSALLRSFDVWVRGLGFHLPLVVLLTLIAGQKRLTKNGITLWDQSRNLRVIHEKIGVVRAIVATVLVLASIYFMVPTLPTSQADPNAPQTAPHAP